MSTKILFHGLICSSTLSVCALLHLFWSGFLYASQSRVFTLSQNKEITDYINLITANTPQNVNNIISRPIPSIFLSDLIILCITINSSDILFTNSHRLCSLNNLTKITLYKEQLVERWRTTQVFRISGTYTRLLFTTLKSKQYMQLSVGFV